MRLQKCLTFGFTSYVGWIFISTAGASPRPTMIKSTKIIKQIYSRPQAFYSLWANEMRSVRKGTALINQYSFFFFNTAAVPTIPTIIIAPTDALEPHPPQPD